MIHVVRSSITGELILGAKYVTYIAKLEKPKAKELASFQVVKRHKGA
jgi:hypothetical protein